jgi:predicted molibdopterin-dependent oxidoreductase YjgC
MEPLKKQQTNKIIKCRPGRSSKDHIYQSMRLSYPYILIDMAFRKGVTSVDWPEAMTQYYHTQALLAQRCHSLAFQ